MTVTIAYNALYEKVSRSLSVIGKRSTDEQGNLRFTDITLSSREREIVNDFFSQAITAIIAETAAYVSASTETGGTEIALTLPSNHNTELEPFIQKTCEEYCVCYALFSWFVITAPTISGKYQTDAQNHLTALVRLISEKTAPKAGDDILATSVEVSQT